MEKRGIIRIICISDTHTYHNKIELPEGDVLIHAGDFSFTGTPGELDSFNTWLIKQDFKHKLIIYGNHELSLDPNKTPYFQNYRDMITEGKVLFNTLVEIDGIRFWGSPYTPEFCNWAFSYSPEEAEDMWSEIPQCDVLITHGPPAGILDKSHPGGISLGCEELREKVLEIKPRLHAFGHIHGGYGNLVYDYGRCNCTNGRNDTITFLNASVVDEAYKVRNKPHVFDL